MASQSPEFLFPNWGMKYPQGYMKKRRGDVKKKKKKNQTSQLQF